MNKVEKVLFYPVANIATVLTLQAWSYQPVPFVAICTLVVLTPWLKPVLPGRFQVLSKVGLWLSGVAFIAGNIWLSIWNFGLHFRELMR